MDEHGFFNFGPNASHMAAVCETSKVVIVEVNENMPGYASAALKRAFISLTLT